MKGQQKDRYLAVTNDLFTTWQSREFMEAQLWLIHRLAETTWQDFVAAHRATRRDRLPPRRLVLRPDRDAGPAGLIKSGKSSRRSGVTRSPSGKKIEPMVREARFMENSVLFEDFERLLPACHECYVP